MEELEENALDIKDGGISPRQEEDIKKQEDAELLEFTQREELQEQVQDQDHMDIEQ